MLPAAPARGVTEPRQGDCDVGGHHQGLRARGRGGREGRNEGRDEAPRVSPAQGVEGEVPHRSTVQTRVRGADTRSARSSLGRGPRGSRGLCLRSSKDEGSWSGDRQVEVALLDQRLSKASIDLLPSLSRTIRSRHILRRSTKIASGRMLVCQAAIWRSVAGLNRPSIIAARTGATQ